MKELVHPFLRPLSERFTAGPWTLSTDSGGRPLPAVLDWWDCASSLEVTRQLTIDVAGVISDCGLNSDGTLVAGLVWSASSTKWRDAGDTVLIELRHGVSSDLNLACVIPGENSGGTLTISLIVALAEASAASSLAPTMPGSILFEESTQVLLEGIAPQFPTVVADFSTSTAFPDPDAPWFLEWSPDDLDLPPDAALVLWLNSRCAPVVSAATADRDVAEWTWLRAAIASDVVVSLLMDALAWEQFVDAGCSYESGSLGQTLRILLSAWFPGATRSDIAEQSASQPEFFRARIRARMGVFRDGEVQ